MISFKIFIYIQFKLHLICVAHFIVTSQFDLTLIYFVIVYQNAIHLYICIAIKLYCIMLLIYSFYLSPLEIYFCLLKLVIECCAPVTPSKTITCIHTLVLSILKKNSLYASKTDNAQNLI